MARDGGRSQPSLLFPVTCVTQLAWLLPAFRFPMTQDQREKGQNSVQKSPTDLNMRLPCLATKTHVSRFYQILLSPAMTFHTPAVFACFSEGMYLPEFTILLCSCVVQQITRDAAPIMVRHI